MVNIASLPNRHPPFRFGVWFEDDIDDLMINYHVEENYEWRLMTSGLFHNFHDFHDHDHLASTVQLAQEGCQDRNSPGSPVSWWSSWWSSMRVNNVHNHNDENLLRQIFDQAWTGQEQPNAPAPALSNCNFNEGRKIFHVKRDGSIWKL